MFKKTYISSQIFSIINRQLRVDVNQNACDLSLREDLKADSLDIVNIIVQLEITFHMPIFDDEINKLKTVKDIVEFVTENSNDDYFVERNSIN